MKLESDLESVVTLGWVELGAAGFAAIGDLNDMWDEIHGKGMKRGKRALVLFLPAITDVLLAALDFFIFTTSAAADNDKIRQSIVARAAEWCITVQDECVVIIDEEAARVGDSRLGKASYDGLIIAFCTTP